MSCPRRPASTKVQLMIKRTEVRRADVFDALFAQMKKFQYKTNLSADEDFLMMPDQALVVPLHEAWVEAATFSYASSSTSLNKPSAWVSQSEALPPTTS